MKKWICLLAGFLCCVLCMLPVRADVIWEPQDAFYEEHSSECEYVGRVFVANGPDGVVVLYKSPVSDQEIATWENGFVAYINFVYKDKNGVEWGVYEGRKNYQTGWMPMEYMDLVYDSIAFVEEYGADIKAQSGSLDEQYQRKYVYFWDYPGAADGYATLVKDLPKYSGVYVDCEGHTWGNVGYYFGHKDFWICLDQPDAEFDVLYPNGAPGIGEYQPVEKDSTQGRITPAGSSGNVVAVAGVAVLLVVLVTGALLFVLRRKTDKGNYTD